MKTELIFASVASAEVMEMLSGAADAIGHGAEGVEFRIDSLSHPTVDDVLLLSGVGVASIATFKKSSTSLLTGDRSGEIFGAFDFIDIERKDIEKIHPPGEFAGKVILSDHLELEDASAAAGLMKDGLRKAGYVKCVNTAPGYGKSMIPCMAASSLGEGAGKAIAFSMGEEGILSRIWSLRSGAPVSYASPAEGRGTAPGQLTVGEMRSAACGTVLGIAGSREATSHSMSPLIHSRLLRMARREGTYLRFPVAQDEFDEFFKAAKLAGIEGFNITMPFKERALHLVDGADRVARSTGAVNTVVNNGGRLRGYNTDAMALSEVVKTLTPSTALIFGSGGTARSAAYVLRDIETSILARNEESAGRIIRDFGSTRFTGAPARFDLLVNCTPAGMGPFNVAIPDAVREGEYAAIVDFVYSAAPTPFADIAAEQSALYTDGFELLARQAVHSFSLWTGVSVPHTEVIALLRGEGVHA